jgi:hypothetical protein
MGLVIERVLLSHLSLKNNKDTGGTPMMKFDFMVQTRDTAIATVARSVARSVALPNSIAVWPLVAKLAHEIDEPGSLILVANDAGEVIIRVGIACARSLANLQPEGAEFAHRRSRNAAISKFA